MSGSYSKMMGAPRVAKVRYLTTDSKVAKVSKSGKITAVSKETCYVYAIAANGISKKIKVTVK